MNARESSNVLTSPQWCHSDTIDCHGGGVAFTSKRVCHYSRCVPQVLRSETISNSYAGSTHDLILRVSEHRLRNSCGTLAGTETSSERLPSHSGAAQSERLTSFEIVSKRKKA